MDSLDRIHAFDANEGVIRADAGLSLAALIRIVLPHGWFPVVLPGTRFVTLGGAVANDIHGKNHHRAGTFGRSVRRLRLRRTDGAVHDLTPADDTGLFAATIGGLGLTGVIEWVEIALRKVANAWLDVEDTPFASPDEFFSLAATSDASHEYTVAWADVAGSGKTLGRGIFSRGNHSDDAAERGAPRLKQYPAIGLPSFALSKTSVKAFNAAYFHLKRPRSGRRRVHYGPFFFPLDALAHWNRLYGAPGFYQYQCVIPQQAGGGAAHDIFDCVARNGEASTLVVLKTFGPAQSPGLLSFPCRGLTVTLDFRNRGEATLRLLGRLDDIVRAAGGRLYPAKDGRMSAAIFAAGYSNLGAFLPHVDPGLSSAFWRRVRP